MSIDRIQKTQEQVDEVTHIMSENIDKVIDREEKLDNLQVRSDKLNEDSHQFKKGATKLKKTMFLQNLKLTFLIAFILIAIILIIVLSIVYSK
ncbi:synaptobrevin family member [Anaeramoeba flamelloides]|uniref:Synaptobrevin family member n=1 Tax=Anaeramoeba flamelloides TaxID=1746091 RepID=A0ABQ8XDW1_9EUKA|nr:synaptobrevin family member [Anaeramoeba flamelloides]